jgi:hypothetical protein
MQRSRSAPIADRGLLALGFLALVGAVATAHSNPATGYELSLYAATPLTFWLLYGCAMFVALFVALRASNRWLRRTALGLGGIATTAFAGLPVLRGYWFYSGGDGLTHLGWARGIQVGNFLPTDLRYPGMHSVTILFDAAFGIDLAHAMLLVVVVLSVLFFAFVTLSTPLVFESRYSTTAAAFSAFMFLPITSLSTHLQPHAMSQAILFSSVAVFLVLKYVRSPASLLSSSAVGASLALTSAALVVYHPQLVAHLLPFFVGICGLQVLYRRWRTDHPIASHRPLYGQTAVLVAAFLAWISNHGFFSGVIGYAVTNALEFFLGGGGAAKDVATQGASLTAIGGSFVGIFLKLFGASLVFMALVGLLVLQTLRDSDRTLTEATYGMIPYFVVGLAGLSGIFALYFFGSVSGMYFRVFGLMMVFVTILGAVAIARGTTALSRRWSAGAVRSAAITGFGIVLVMSLLTVFPSTFIYLPSPHVTEMTMSGHETAFDHQGPDVEFVGIRAGPNRYADIERAELGRTGEYGAVNGSEIERGLAGQSAEDRYLTMTQLDWEREVKAYDELRYTRTQLDSIGERPEVARVQSNGEFELFYVDSVAD